MRGKTLAETTAELAAGGMAADQVALLAPYRSFPGNQPSTTLLLPRLDPFTLGALLALYEHKVFVESVIWDINPFDQWGVEYGKQLASRLLPVILGTASGEHLDSSTAGLVAACRGS
jgi:glucose-6-phosphate isomerase